MVDMFMYTQDLLKREPLGLCSFINLLQYNNACDLWKGLYCFMFRLQKMYVIQIRAKIVERVFQPTHLMTANVHLDGLDHTVKVSDGK